jgi:hypothetical protein
MKEKVMGLKISSLLKWKSEVKLQRSDGTPIKGTDGKQVSVWVRIIGDQDLQDTYKIARVKSARLRKALQNPDSLEWAESVEPVRAATKEESIELIKTARTSNLYAEAVSGIERPDEIPIAEIAVDPDAPTLEEQEKHDAANAKQDEEYQAAIAEFQTARMDVLDVELKAMTLAQLRQAAEEELATVLALSAFLTEVQDQKISRACYEDPTCLTRAFSDVDDYRSTDADIKMQLAEAYMNLEKTPDELKN